MSYEAEFYWAEPATSVFVTGTFDNWSQSVKLDKTPAGFSGKVPVPYSTKVDFKFVVDGQWVVNPHFPTTYDWRGNINNYIMTPAAPEPEAEAQPEPVVAVPEPIKEVEPEPVKEVTVPEPEPVKVSEPEPVPELKVETAPEPVHEEAAEPEPVTPINVPAIASVAVTPMNVPESVVTPSFAVDPAVGRSVVESLAEANTADVIPQEKTEEKSAEVITEAKTDDVVALNEVIVTPEPVVSSAQEEPKEENLSTPVEEKKQFVIVPVAPIAEPAPVVAPESIVPTIPEAPRTPPPAKKLVASPEPVTPSAVPVPETPAAEKTKDVAQPPSQFSTASTTSTPTKEDRPAPLKKGSSTRSSSRIFSFPGHARKGSHDSSPPTSPAASLKKDDSVRKKRNSFLGKVQNLFHPNHKHSP